MNDTIAAITTAYGNAGVGIIRVSGPNSIEVTNKIWSGDIVKYLTHSVHYGKVIKDGEIIDEAILLVMKAPNSYTGEDVVEIQCHGGNFVVKKILNLLLDCGARIAEPGEFTKRAFLNGKMDLSSAEAVMDVIESTSESSRRAATNQLEGSIGNLIRDLRARILNKTAYIETALDDPEHISLEGFGDQLSSEVDSIRTGISELIDTWDNGHIIKEGIKTVILGKPNVGKSSLMNAILGKSRAIVTDVPGTTRDVIEESVSINNIILKIIDTAGIRETNDEVEKIGVDKAIKEGSSADLILYVIDLNSDISSELSKAIEFSNRNNIIIVFNKIDLINQDDLINTLNNLDIRLDLEIIPNNNINNTMSVITKDKVINSVLISASNNMNINSLYDIISNMFDLNQINNNDEVIITNIRHKECLLGALSYLDKVKTSISNNMPEDFYTIDLMGAYETLGLITGDNTSEDLVNEIFSKFCVGK